MTQIRDTRFHALDTSLLQNRRSAEVVRSGVYAGFRLRPNAAEANKLDITTGADSTSVLITGEGVRIEEDQEVLGVFVIQNADPNLKRIDLAVLEYQFSTDNNVEASYKVIRGQNQPSLTEEPTAPAVQNAFQVPIAEIVVRPQVATGGVPAARVAASDIIHLPKASSTLAPEQLSALLPQIDATDSQLIYVHPGIFPSFDGSRDIVFPGGYSPVVDPDTLSEGEERWYLIGISDDNEIVLFGDAATRAGLPTLARDILPLCITRAERIVGVVRHRELYDIRFPFARNFLPQIEEEAYKNTLSESVFNRAFIDLLRDTEDVELTSVSDSDVTVELDRSTSSLKVTYTGMGQQPAADVTISTKDLLGGTTSPNIEYFMVLADSSIPGLTFRFSTTSAFSGDQQAVIRSGRIARVPAGGAGKLFLRFHIPADAFLSGDPLLIFSYALYYLLDEAALGATVVTEVGGVNVLKNAIPNLCANGNFRFWSRDDINGNTPDPDDTDPINYPVSVSGARHAADGWALTRMTFEAQNGTVGRRGLAKDVVMAGIDNADDTCLFWESAGAEGGAVNELEYRVPVPARSGGERVTFAIDFRASEPLAVSIGVALYERTEEGKLRLQGVIPRNSASVSSGTLTVTSESQINEATFAIGLIVYLQQRANDSSVALFHARAAIGEFLVLPYTEPVDAQNVLRQYYERGRVYASASALEAQVLGTAIQFGSRKHLGLGPVTARTISESDSNRSLNVDTLQYNVDRDGLVVTATSQVNGMARIDADYEVFVEYEEVV